MLGLLLVPAFLSGQAGAGNLNGKIAFEAGDQIYVINTDGTGLVQLTSAANRSIGPHWSPDGSKITFASNRTGNWDVYVMNADGSNQTDLTPSSSATELSPSFSHDGTEILFRSDLSLKRMPAGGGTVSPIVPGGLDGDEPVESPDGTAFTFTDLGSTVLSVYRYAGGGTNPLVLASDGSFNYAAAWSADGSRVLWRALPSGGGQWSIESVAADATGRTTVVPGAFDPAPSPDGTKLAYATGGAGIFVAAADGTGAVEIPNSHLPAGAFSPAWQPVPDTAQPGPVFTVNSSADPGNGSCTVGECTLREAIAAANARPGNDTITFAIPGAGEHVIQPATALPQITDAVAIDGSGQVDGSGWPLIRVDGGAGTAPSLYGLEFNVPLMPSSVSDLAFTRWDAGNGAGLHVTNTGLVTVRGSLLGTDHTGAAGLGSYSGIQVDNASTIGGITAADRNVISGNSLNGIYVAGGAAVIHGNWIGVGPDGTSPLGNGSRGVFVQALGTQIGGTGVGEGNVIRNNGIGVQILNGSSGVSVRGNSIDANTGLGIDLSPTGVSPNDPGDGDAGANGLQNFPVLTGASLAAGSVTVRGTLNSTASATFLIDVYTSPTCDASGNGQGRTYLGTTTVGTDGSGNASFTGLVLPTSATQGQVVTATATSAAGDTSEFSACTTIGGSGSLVGSRSAAGGTIDLTAQGLDDWAVWGYSNNAGTQCTVDGSCSVSLAPDVRKAGGSAISDLVNVDPGPAIPLRGLGFVPSQPFTFSWSNGAPAGSVTGARTGLQHNGGSPTNASTLGRGFRFTVPADTISRTLKVWVAQNRAGGHFTASLSDGSSAAFADSYDVGVGDFVGSLYTLTYSAGSPGQTLTVSWVENADNCTGFRCDNVSIHAVALSGGSVDPAQTGPTYTVNSAADPGDGSCTVANCTLREAIGAAGSGDAIKFAIPGAGVHTISPVDALPSFGGALLDGWSQGGASYTGPPLIEIDGTAAGASADGLYIDGDGAEVRGLAIGGFGGDGIELAANYGLEDPSFRLRATYLGTDATGNTARPNGRGFYTNDTHNLVIGGPNASDRNVISGNSGNGIELDPSSNVTIEGNSVGVGASGSAALGNGGAGILFDSCCSPVDSTVVRNVIGNNGGAGIANAFDDGFVKITQNSIHDNGGLGIDLQPEGEAGVTPNDLSDCSSVGDQDSGPNGLQNYPDISSATVSGPQATIDYSIDTQPGTYTIEFFASATPDPSGYGEGARYLGADSITISGCGRKSGSVTLTPSVAVQVGDSISATATDTAGNTSEFSADETAASGAPPVVTGLTLTGPPTADAGASVVPLAGVPPAALVTPQTSGTKAAPVNQLPVNQLPVNQLPVNQLPVNQLPVNQLPVNQLPVNQLPVNQLGLAPDFRSLVLQAGPLGDTALSTIPLLRPGGWSAVLPAPLSTTPLQSVTLRQVFSLSPLPAPLQPGATNPIRFADIDFSNSTLGSLPAMTLALGQLPVSDLPAVDWCELFSGPPLNCAGSLPTGTSLLSAALQGAPVDQSPVNQLALTPALIGALARAQSPVNQLPVNQLPVNQLPVNQLPVNQLRILSFPVNQLPVNQLRVNDSPVNQLSLAAILAANAPVQGSPVNQLPVNQLPVNQLVLDCTGQCTGTLGDYVGKVLPGVTLGDLRRALPGDVPDDWTIANLEEFANLIVGDLLSSLPQPNNLTLADVIALALFGNNPESFAFETLNIFDTGLALYADPVGSAGYSVGFTLSPNGGPTGVSSALSISVTLPRTFAYRPGSSQRVSGSSTCSSEGLPVADPVLTQVSPGVTKATWSVPGNVGSSYKLCFSAAPGIVLGPQSASASATPDGGATVSADAPEPVTVVDGGETSNTPAGAPTLTTSNLYLSYLTSAADVDYYKVAVPAVGSRTTFHLSHLPADYDLVVYGPEQTPLRAASPSTPPLDGAPLTDTGAELTHVTDSLPSQTLDDLRLQSLPIVGVSASRGADPEDITVLSDGSGGFYTVQVTSYNGATSADPYMLRITSEEPRAPATTTARSVTGTSGSAVGTLPAGFNTLFLVNLQRLEGLYGASAATSVLGAITGNQASFSSLGFPNALLSVDAYPAVRDAYAAWDAKPGDPDLANKVVAAINAVVDSQVRTQPNGAGLKYLVIVGNDQVIPQGRLGDFTTAANEAGYADTFDRSSDLYGTLRAGQMLSDDPYGTLEPVPYLNRQLYVPRLSVGRLVETPAEIAATLNRFTAFSGRLNPSTSLVTGYDFMQDGANAINAPFATRFGTGAQTQISNTWTRGTLLQAFLPTGGSAPSITSLNGHADHYEFAQPDVTAPFFTTGDLPLGPLAAPAGSTGPLVNRLVFSMGCHSGLSVSDAVVTANTYDWPQAYSKNGVGAYLGNTGFGYGDSLVVAYSELLDSIFAKKIAAGATVGNAVAAAKQEYFGSLGVFGVYDEKAMAEFTLYGLPMWSVTTPDGGVAPASAATAPATPSGDVQTLSLQAAAAVPTSTSVVTDAATGLEAEAFTLDNIANTETSTGLGRYWSGPDGVQATHFRPLQPKAFVELAGTAGHGALITELRQLPDTPNVDPVFARPIVDTQSTEPELSFGDVAFPARLQALRTFTQDGKLVQRVVLMTGQFFTDTNPGNNGKGVQRLYKRIGARVLRSPSNDFVPPAFTRIDATKVGSTAAFSIDVSDLTQTGGAGTVKRVLVALRSGTATTWTFSDLGRVGTSSTWSGGIPLANATDPFEYFVQAVDAAGNVGVSTNKGFYFAAAAPAAPTGDVTVAPAPTGPSSVNGWFTGSKGVVVDGPAGVTLEASVDGGPFAAVAPGTGPTVTGDGVHTVEARGSNGGTATTVVAIDASDPSVAIGAPVAGGSYVLGSVTQADFSCSDAGSGVASCTGTVQSGTPLPTSTLGTSTFTVTAVDNTGRTTTRSVTYNVIWPFVVYASGRTGNGDIYSVDTRGGAPVQLTSGNAVDAEPAWSPDRKKIAFTSTRDGNVEIYVMNANGTGVTRLTNNGAVDASPAWSPDGTKIAFVSNRTGGNVDIFVMSATGANVTRLTTDSGADTFPAWSPNGAKIAFSSSRTGAGDIYAMNANGTAQTRLTTSSAVDTEPDWFGSKIAFSTNRDGVTNFEVYVMNDTGTAQTRLTTDARPDTSPAWSPDGQKIAFASNRPGGANFDIFTMNANGTGQASLVPNPAPDLFPDW